MSLIPYPNVPNVPGVPTMLRNFTVPTAGSLLNMGLGLAAEAIFGKVVWGVYEDVAAVPAVNAMSAVPWTPTNPAVPEVKAVPARPATTREALSPDSFLDIDYKNDTRVSNYPQEAGAFAAYNKVGTPYDCRVRMAIGGDKASRTKFLAKCEAMLKGIDLYTVITPEATYTNAALQNYSYKRDEKNGASMLTVDLQFTEVRITATAQYKTAAQPSGAAQVSGGQVQPAKPPSGLQKIIGAVSGAVGAVQGAVTGAVASAQGAIQSAVGSAQKMII